MRQAKASLPGPAGLAIRMVPKVHDIAILHLNTLNTRAKRLPLMTDIRRLKTGQRMSQAVIHGNTVYLAGQVATGAAGKSIAEQTRDILDRIDALLKEAGTDKTKLLSATIWLADISSFAEMNSIWDSWVSPGNTPARACVEAKLAAPEYTVEIGIIAAI